MRLKKIIKTFAKIAGILILAQNINSCNKTERYQRVDKYDFYTDYHTHTITTINTETKNVVGSMSFRPYWTKDVAKRIKKKKKNPEIISNYDFSKLEDATIQDNNKNTSKMSFRSRHLKTTRKNKMQIFNKITTSFNSWGGYHFKDNSLAKNIVSSKICYHANIYGDSFNKQLYDIFLEEIASKKNKKYGLAVNHILSRFCRLKIE